ncbi:MAG TPA: endolytic transglycosylase MltG [Polyangiaceae bacterium]|nr:endolytic transglycosylase MltG [Polyangiaceae bacterium]
MTPATDQRRKRPSRPTARRKRRYGSLWLGIAVALASALIAGTATVLIWATLETDAEDRAVFVTFRGAESADETAARLGELGLVSRPALFSIYMGWFAPSVRVAGGEHLLRTGLSPRRILQRLGRLPSRPSSKVSLPEGYTSFQMADRLQERDICGGQAFLKAARDPALLESLGVVGTSAEGYLFPATYELMVDSDPVQVIRQLVAELRKRLTKLDARANGGMSRLERQRGWKERDVLTLASIIEREAAVKEERPLIASVFLNRLDDPSFRPPGMLQSDPTAAYGCLAAPTLAPSCAGYTGRVTPEMLRDGANPYNTYRHSGLPPGPIANAGEDAIFAVLSPASTSFLYFVADGRGRHRFSRSFEEHRRAIEQGVLPLGNEQR